MFKLEELLDLHRDNLARLDHDDEIDVELDLNGRRRRVGRLDDARNEPMRADPMPLC